MTVIADEIVDLAVAHEALDQGYVDAPRQLALAASDGANAGTVDRQEGLQPLAPLVDQLPPMHEHERVEAACCDHAGADHGFTESCRGGEHAEIVRLECSDGCCLHVVDLAQEGNVEGSAVLALVGELRFRAAGLDELNHLVETAARQCHMTWVQLGTRNDPRLAVGRQPHGLGAIELWVLECRDPDELCDQGRR